MPLKRLNEAYAIELDGIGFGMVDEQWRKWPSQQRLLRSF
jgi:hypothetical protein